MVKILIKLKEDSPVDSLNINSSNFITKEWQEFDGDIQGIENILYSRRDILIKEVKENFIDVVDSKETFTEKVEDLPLEKPKKLNKKGNKK